MAQNIIEIVNDDTNVISNGLHYLSGVGDTTINIGYSIDDEETEVTLFCIDGKTYGAYTDPSDGYRSYGAIHEFQDKKCQYNFEPQEVYVTNKTIKGDEEYFADDKHLLVITDAKNGKEVLVIGTNYADSYYPCAIFHYMPENLEVNQYENQKCDIEYKVTLQAETTIKVKNITELECKLANIKVNATFDGEECQMDDTQTKVLHVAKIIHDNVNLS